MFRKKNNFNLKKMQLKGHLWTNYCYFVLWTAKIFKFTIRKYKKKVLIIIHSHFICSTLCSFDFKKSLNKITRQASCITEYIYDHISIINKKNRKNMQWMGSVLLISIVERLQIAIQIAIWHQWNQPSNNNDINKQI